MRKRPNDIRLFEWRNACLPGKLDIYNSLLFYSGFLLGSVVDKKEEKNLANNGLEPRLCDYRTRNSA